MRVTELISMLNNGPLFTIQNEDEPDLNYAAIRFSAGKHTRGKKRNENMDSVYSQIKL